LRRPFDFPTQSRSLFLTLVLFLGIAAAPVRAERVRVALLPVVVQSSEGREYLQSGLADMLVARLGRDPRIAVVKVSDPAAATTDFDAARETARGEDARWVVYGSFTRFGEGASLDLQCARVNETGEPHQVFAQAATLGALIPMLEGVSERITGYVLGTAGDAAPVAAAGARGSASGGEVVELRRRVEALERAVDALGAARMPKEPEPEAQGSERE
jgi:outer membrane protein insertion porin family